MRPEGLFRFRILAGSFVEPCRHCDSKSGPEQCAMSVRLLLRYPMLRMVISEISLQQYSDAVADLTLKVHSR